MLSAPTKIGGTRQICYCTISCLVYIYKLSMYRDNLKCLVGCRCVAHRQSIDTYYKDIICALKCASSVCVPRIPFKCLKSFWSDELDRLEEQSIDMHNLWIQCGKPRSGIIDTTRLWAKYDYKQAIRKAADDFETLHADEISEHLLNKDSKQFWRAWTAKNSSKLDTDISIDGKSNYKDIAT